jgi:hypothetical protein
VGYNILLLIPRQNTTLEKRVHSQEHDKMILLGVIGLVIWSVVFITEEFYHDGRGVWCAFVPGNSCEMVN